MTPKEIRQMNKNTKKLIKLAQNAAKAVAKENRREYVTAVLDYDYRRGTYDMAQCICNHNIPQSYPHGRITAGWFEQITGVRPRWEAP
jgi:hypothetical protein